MHDNEPYDPTTDVDVAAYQDEARERWGDTDAYQQSMVKVRRLTKAEMEKLKADGRAFGQKLADSTHLDPTSPAAQELIAQHHAGINFFYDCNTQIYRGLGQMYVDDPRFTAYYDGFKPGLAAWLNKGIAHYCDLTEASARK